MNEGIAGFLGFLAFCLVVLLFRSKRRLHRKEEAPGIRYEPIIYSYNGGQSRLRKQEEQLTKRRLKGIRGKKETAVQKRRLRKQEERRFRTSELADVDNMSPYEFEKFVGELMKRRGYTTAVVGQAGDMGVDVVAQKGDKKYAVQVKRHSSRVSRRAVSDAVAGKEHYGCNAAMVVTNNHFTKGAEELARSTKCELVGRDTLADWIVAPRKGD